MGDQSQGNGAPGASQGNDEPKFVTEEQLNKAITSRFTDFAKKHEKTLGDTFTAFEKKLLEALPKTPEPAATTTPPDAKSILDHPEVKGMAKKLQDLEERARVAEERTLAEQKRAKDLSIRQRVGEAVAKANVNEPTRAKHAVSFLIRENLVKWSDDGKGDELVFASDDGDIDFKTGFDRWLKSEDAKLYLPSPDAAATQQRGTQQQQRVAPGAGAAPNFDDLSFEDKLAISAQQLQKTGVGL